MGEREKRKIITKRLKVFFYLKHCLFRKDLSHWTRRDVPSLKLASQLDTDHWAKLKGKVSILSYTYAQKVLTPCNMSAAKSISYLFSTRSKYKISASTVVYFQNVCNVKPLVGIKALFSLYDFLRTLVTCPFQNLVSRIEKFDIDRSLLRCQVGIESPEKNLLD